MPYPNEGHRLNAAQATAIVDVLDMLACWYDDLGPASHFTCSETEALCSLLDRFGRSDPAAALRRAHAEHDEPGDLHYAEASEDDANSDPDPHPDLYCNYCETEGHTFRSCPRRDDDQESYDAEAAR